MKHMNVALFVPHMGCKNACIFCNQRIISGKSCPLTPEQVISAAEIAARTPHDIENSEIAFFGGSFTAIEEERMISYLEAAKPYIGTQFSGIRISTRPDCIDERKLAVLKEYGVTAIELGAQSMSDTVLEKNRRGHSAADTVRASRLIRRQGFSLGLQMMTGLYGSDAAAELYTAQSFIGLSPDTVRIYPTTVLEGTELCRLYQEKKYIPPDFSAAVELCAELLELFYENNIKVIRLGLHSGGNVEEGFVAGVYHPAFRELCEGVIYRKKIDSLLAGMPRGSYTVFVNGRELSKARGQKKCNIAYFSALGKELCIQARDTLSVYEVSL